MQVGLLSFNLAAICSVFHVFYTFEKKNNEEFGKVMRDHVSTIGVAMFLSLIFTAIDLAEMLGVKFD